MRGVGLQEWYSNRAVRKQHRALFRDPYIFICPTLLTVAPPLRTKPCTCLRRMTDAYGLQSIEFEVLAAGVVQQQGSAQAAPGTVQGSMALVGGSSASRSSTLDGTAVQQGTRTMNNEPTDTSAVSQHIQNGNG